MTEHALDITFGATCTQRRSGNTALDMKLWVPAANSGRNANARCPGESTAISSVNQPGLGVVTEAIFRPTTPISQLCSFGTGDQRMATAENSYRVTSFR